MKRILLTALMMCVAMGGCRQDAPPVTDNASEKACVDRLLNGSYHEGPDGIDELQPLFAQHRESQLVELLLQTNDWKVVDAIAGYFRDPERCPRIDSFASHQDEIAAARGTLFVVEVLVPRQGNGALWKLLPHFERVDNIELSDRPTEAAKQKTVIALTLLKHTGQEFKTSAEFRAWLEANAPAQP